MPLRCNRCTTKGEEDYRPLFENFVQDLLATVNKPEWPASELLLSLLGRILVSAFACSYFQVIAQYLFRRTIQRKAFIINCSIPLY